MNREKRTYAGKLFTADFYPIFSDGRRIPSRAPKTKRSSAEQEKYNHNKAVRNIVERVNANFDERDYYEHPTFIPALAPQTREDAQRELKNHLARVKRRRQSELKKAKKALAAMPDTPELREQREQIAEKVKCLERPMKYAYSIEQVTYRSGEYKGRVNWHYHLFVTGGLDDRTMERLWDKGVRVNVDNYQPDRFGPEAAAKYMTKSNVAFGKKKYICSRNMVPPKVPDPSKRDGKTSQRQFEHWAKERVDDAAFWERRYKGYRFLRCYARRNPYNGRWYLSVVMYRTDKDPPPWTLEDWGVLE